MKKFRRLQIFLLFILPAFIPVHAQTEEAIYGMVAFVSGEAWVIHPGSEPVPAKLSMTIKPEDTIKTGKGQVRVQIADIFICHIEKNSSSTFREILNNTEGESLNVYLQKGQIFSRLIPGKKKKSQFVVTTPSVTAGVRGTEFMVSENVEESDSDEQPIPSGVFVSTGKVEVESSDGKFKVAVNGGEQATTAPGELRKAILEDFIATKMKILEELKIMKEFNCKLIDEQKEKNRKLLEEFK